MVPNAASSQQAKYVLIADLTGYILPSFTYEHWILNAGRVCVCVCVCVCTFKSLSKITIARSYLTIQINDNEIVNKTAQFSNLTNYVKIPTKRE